MADEKHNLTTEELLRALLPVVVDAATKAAEGTANSASAIGSFETQLGDIRSEYTTVRDALKETTLAVNNLADVRKEELEQRKIEFKAEQKQQTEREKRKYRLIGGIVESVTKNPQVILYLIMIVLSVFGFRLTFPQPIQIPAIQVGETTNPTPIGASDE